MATRIKRNCEIAKTRKKVKSARVITEICDTRKLSPKENYLLWCIHEDLMARALAVKTETLNLWRSLGMPATVIRNNSGEIKYFYNHFDVQSWLQENIDLVYLKTPERLLVQQLNGYIVIEKIEERNLILPKDPDLKRLCLEKFHRVQGSPQDESETQTA